MVCKSKEYKKTLNKQFKLYQKSFVHKLRGLRTTNPKAYLSLLNRDNNSSKIVQKISLNVFNEHFQDLNNVQSDVDITLPDDISEYNSVINEQITEKEIENAIKSLKNKACGGNMILNEFLKYSSV